MCSSPIKPSASLRPISPAPSIPIFIINLLFLLTDYVTLSDPNDYKGGAEKRQNPFGPNFMAFTSPEDLMKNLPKAWEIFLWLWEGATLTDSPTFKISMREYEEIGIKVGDIVVIEIKKSDNSGI